MSKALELTGKKFGHLTVIRRATVSEYGDRYKYDRGHVRWIARCECGKEKVYPGSRMHRGQLTSCGCLIGNNKPDGEAAKWSHYTWYRAIAKRRNKTFLLTLQEFLRITSSPCCYCGIPWSADLGNRKRPNGIKRHRGDYRHNGIDRIDSSIGYVPDNCVPCCRACNTAKAEMNQEQFKAWIGRVHDHYVRQDELKTVEA